MDKVPDARKHSPDFNEVVAPARATEFAGSWGAANSVPVLSNVNVSSPINEGDTATLAGEIVDGNTGDSLTLTVDWGDGNSQTLESYDAQGPHLSCRRSWCRSD